MFTKFCSQSKNNASDQSERLAKYFCNSKITKFLAKPAEFRVQLTLSAFVAFRRTPAIRPDLHGNSCFSLRSTRRNRCVRNPTRFEIRISRFFYFCSVKSPFERSSPGQLRANRIIVSRKHSIFNEIIYYSPITCNFKTVLDRGRSHRD